VEVGQEGDGDEDNDGLLAVADLNLNSENNVRALSDESVVHTGTEFLLERRLALRIFISTCILPPLLMIPLHVGDF
jgi:hypothetical protein